MDHGFSYVVSRTIDSIRLLRSWAFSTLPRLLGLGVQRLHEGGASYPSEPMVMAPFVDFPMLRLQGQDSVLAVACSGESIGVGAGWKAMPACQAVQSFAAS